MKSRPGATVTLTEKQKGVLRGVVSGMLMSLALVVAGARFNPFSFDESLSQIERVSVALQCSLLPAFFLAVSVGRLAKHRFFTPEDIDGGGLSNGSDEAKVLQSLLQNTLEQFVLAFVIYVAWAIVAPASWLSVVPLAAMAFAIGRMMFFVGYKRGAPARAVGFTLSFYPTIIMMFFMTARLIWRQFS